MVYKTLSDRLIRYSIWATAALAASSALSFTAPNQTTIEGFNANGDGCPSGSYSYLLTPDKQTLQILFSKFIAELAPVGTFVSNPPTRACTVSFQLKLPAGLALTWYRTEHRGFADTSGGASGQFVARYYLPGQGGFDVFRSFPINPYQVAAYTVINDNLGGSWTACGGSRLLSINTRIRLSGRPTGYNTLTVDDETEKVETILRFRYRSCI